jgi:carbon storage regulator
MLVVRRKIGQSVFVGEDVTVTVVEIGARHVRLGIRAPRSVKVDREEIRRLRQIAATRTNAG